MDSLPPPTRFGELTTGSSFDIEDDLCDELTIVHNATEADAYTYNTGEMLFTTICLPVLLIVGIIGNVAFIYVVLRAPRMKTITNCYLICLSIADSLFLVSAIGSKLWMYIKSPFNPDDGPIGPAGCILVNFVSITTYTVSLIFITLVSLERFWGVCRPHRKRDTNRKVFTIITVSTVLSAMLSGTFMPSFAAIMVECYVWPEEAPYNSWPTMRISCKPIKRWHDLYTNGSQTIPFFITLVVNVILYDRIISGLAKSMKKSQGNKMSSRKERDAKTRNQVAKMLVINGVVFFVCLAPFEIMSLFWMIAELRGGGAGAVFLAPPKLIIIMLYISRAMSYLNSAVNPIIYTALSVRYREAFKYCFIPDRCKSTGYKSSALRTTVNASVISFESKI